jgi:hypothetical protein
LLLLLLLQLPPPLLLLLLLLLQLLGVEWPQQQLRPQQHLRRPSQRAR